MRSAMLPVLLHTDEDRYRSLFAYLAVLDAGVIVLVIFRHWWAVASVSRSFPSRPKGEAPALPSARSLDTSCGNWWWPGGRTGLATQLRGNSSGGSSGVPLQPARHFGTAWVSTCAASGGRNHATLPHGGPI